MARARSSNKGSDPSLALQAAKAFLHQSMQFTNQMPDSVREPPTLLSRNIGGLVVAATTLALATELHLKALLMLVCGKVPQTHHLWSLFKRLPIELQLGIDNEVEERFNALPNKVVAIEVALSLATASEVPPDDALPAPPTDLKSVLIRSSDAFVTWRYLHEQGEQGKHVFLALEFTRLGILCKVLGEVVELGMKNGTIEVTLLTEKL